MPMKTPALVAALLIAAATPLAAQTPPPRFGFGPGLPSAELAKLPQTKGAKGDQQRHYYFADAMQEMPYHLYVPQNYDPKVGAPLVVALHGYFGNHDYFFALVDDLKTLCDKYGFIFVAPMGYTVGNWYGAPMSVPGGPPPGANGQRTPPPPGLPPGPPDGPHERQLSETDVMTVVGIVRAEYNIDPSRVYLMGHSMGGAGTWSLAHRYPDIWAAIGPMSGTLSEADYDYPKLAKIPAIVAVGGLETGLVTSSKAEIAAMKRLGMTTRYVEIEGGTHMSMIPASVPQVLAFFAEQRKAPAGR
jgi:poly(3-hydroxybutyrate) depolymerase